MFYTALDPILYSPIGLQGSIPEGNWIIIGIGNHRGFTLSLVKSTHTHHQKGWRNTIRRLNTVTVAEPFLMPTIDSIIARVGNSTYLSKLDLLKGFHQVPMEEESKQYTAFSCAHGKFQYKVMPLGLKNAPATFQLLMQRILAGCEEFALPYIDDIIIYSTSFTDHLTPSTPHCRDWQTMGSQSKAANVHGVTQHLNFWVS